MKTIKITLESNGAKAFYEINENFLKNPVALKDLAENIEDFYKYFWDNGEENWLSCNQKYINFFDEMINKGGMLQPLNDVGKPMFYDSVFSEWVTL